MIYNYLTMYRKGNRIYHQPLQVLDLHQPYCPEVAVFEGKKIIQMLKEQGYKDIVCLCVIFERPVSLLELSAWMADEAPTLETVQTKPPKAITVQPVATELLSKYLQSEAMKGVIK